jgi:hypothetical protein
MPSLSPKRTVRYTAADSNALASTITLVEFISDFDRNHSKDDATRLRSGLEKLAAYVTAQRNGKTSPAAE